MKLSTTLGIQSFGDTLARIAESEREEFLVELDKKFDLCRTVTLSNFKKKYPEVYLFLTNIDEDKFVFPWIESLKRYDIDKLVIFSIMTNDKDLEVEISDTGFIVASKNDSIPLITVDRSKALQLAQILNSETTSLEEKVGLIKDLVAK